MKVKRAYVEAILLHHFGLLDVEVSVDIQRTNGTLNNFEWTVDDGDRRLNGWAQVTSEGNLEVHMNPDSSAYTPPVLSKKEMDAKLIERGFMPPRNVVEEL